MDLTTLLGILLGSGGLTALATLPYARKKAKREVEQSVIDSWIQLKKEVDDERAADRKRLDAVEAKSDAQYEIIMRSFTCKLLLQNTNDVCPVQKAYEEHNAKN